MRGFQSGLYVIVFVVLTVPLLLRSAQTAPAPSAQENSSQAGSETPPQAPAESPHPEPNGRTARYGRRGPHPTPCWKVAGIAPTAVNQRWHIEDDAKGKIQEVCSDPALNAGQKREKIREINAHTEQEIAKIIPAKQLDAFKGCQAEQDQERAKRPGKTPQKELGPCGGIIPPQPAAPQHSHGQASNPLPQ